MDGQQGGAAGQWRRQAEINATAKETAVNQGVNWVNCHGSSSSAESGPRPSLGSVNNVWYLASLD